MRPRSAGGASVGGVHSSSGGQGSGGGSGGAPFSYCWWHWDSEWACGEACEARPCGSDPRQAAAARGCLSSVLYSTVEYCTVLYRIIVLYGRSTMS